MRRFVLPILLAATLPAGGLRIVPGMNAFTAESYRQLAGGDANLILSPFNIGTTLSMALGGARGATASEIVAVLHQHYDAGYDSALASLAADLTKAGNAGAPMSCSWRTGFGCNRALLYSPRSRKRLPTSTMRR